MMQVHISEFLFSEISDREIEMLKHDYEEKIAQERQTNLKAQGDINVLNKKFGYLVIYVPIFTRSRILTAEIDDLKAQIVVLMEDKKALSYSISTWEKEASGLRKEIRDR